MGAGLLRNAVNSCCPGKTVCFRLAGPIQAALREGRPEVLLVISFCDNNGTV
jgi:hypothetical protein